MLLSNGVILMNSDVHYFPGISISKGLDPAHFHDTFSIHTHNNAEIFCFLSGKALYHVEGTVYPLSPGDVLLMRPAEAHFIETNDAYDYERIIVNFDPSVFTELDPENTLLLPLYDRTTGKRNHYRAEDFSGNGYLQHLEALLAPDCDHLTALAHLILLMKELNSIFSRGEAISQPDTPEYRLIRYINSNLEKDLSIQTLCQRFFLSRSQLCQRFKESTGTSIGKYISSKRMILARQKIRQGQKPTDIYTACGYQDYSTFYRAYTRFFGSSPKEKTDWETDRIHLI